ncbi:MAG: radical SAM protein [Methanobacteriota archaeon]
METKKIRCATALSFSSLPGLTYSLNPYRGCQHNCAYCYVPNVLHIPRERWGTFVHTKHNIPQILEKELLKKKGGVVGISTVTDPYQPIEKHEQLTRQCLGKLLLHDYPICVQTKSSLILRDLDLLSRFNSAEIMMSIGTLNDAERILLEPYASPINERLKVLKKTADNGIKTSVFFGPIYPTITTEEIPQILNTFINHHITEILIDRFNLKPGILENIHHKTQGHPLQQSFTTPKDNYNTTYTKIREELIRLGTEQGIRIIDAF